jgi:hypothetical protein
VVVPAQQSCSAHLNLNLPGSTESAQKQYVTTCNTNTAADHLQQAFSDPIVLDAHTLHLQASFFKFNFTTKNFSSSILSHLMCNQNLERVQDVVCSGLVASFHE